MTRSRYTLTPQMAQYDDFVDRGETRWVPYLMYTHRASYRSPVVNTDRLGFRYAHGPDGQRASAAEPVEGTVSLVAGSSTAFGVGTTGDGETVASRLWSHSTPGEPWLNFGVRGYNSTQEALLYLLHRELVPSVRRIVILSGLNNLALAGLPRSLQGDYGPFFFSGEYFGQMDELRARHRKSKRGGIFRRGAESPEQADGSEPPVTAQERMELAVERTAQDLARWRLIAPEAEITFGLQPLATWVRDAPTAEEKELFVELNTASSSFWRLFGDIATPEVGRRYAEQLGRACTELGVTFFDLNPLLADAADPRQWLFVDRAHFTDPGYALVSDLIADRLRLSSSSPAL